jgi:pyruvate-formate lyase-activating enzyme
VRIAFFHPYKMRQHFFVEAVETAMIADLVALGHEAEAVEYVLDPKAVEADEIREMRAGLDAGRYDLIFVDRPWSDEMVRSLDVDRVVALGRPEMVEKGLVRVGVATPSREVVTGLVRALAAGAPLAEQPGLVLRDGDRVVWTAAAQPVSTLRELGDATLDHRRRRVLSVAQANPKRAVVLSNHGCAYRNVPNRTGTFDGVPMPADVSTAGCTFCDASAYERMTEQDAIALIVRQVEAVLRDRPEVVEIAIKDDYALRFLADLGDALGKLDMKGRDVMLSARGDYLIEFARDIEEALAGRFPCRLSFYLIGFENFSEAELVRFNKGMTAAQVERVIELLRGWAARYPGRFRLTPTGGFILFTPWTTIADLRTNASAIRRLGFEELRGRAILSQLRLYPNLPLYWLAKRDGLLTESFDREDMSDARRRGYEADCPYRFADERVARVHRALLDADARGEKDLLGVLDDALDDVEGLPRRARPAAPAKDNAPGPEKRGVAALALSRACNQACAFCTYRGQDTDAPRARAARAIQATKAAARAGVRTLVLGGAEPTLEWYLPALVELAKSERIAEIVVETNATTLAGGLAAELAKAGLTRAVVALNTLDAARSDALARDPGGHARTLAGIRALLDAGVPVELTSVLAPGLEGALADLVSRAREVLPDGAARIEAVSARHVTAGPPGSGWRPMSKEEAAREIAAAQEASARSGLPLRLAPGTG